ncbi:hypothetical protein ACFWH4_16780, partial [Streptomyces sp. NPDC127091]|uniref:hypothetical protein n=1 Tax=Streptomyces sp. NPDC127091 TaxID=3347134 RepID=UPI0036536967
MRGDLPGRQEGDLAAPGRPLTFHLHQRQAIKAAQAGDSYVLTTGTGSGRSLSYIVPIVDRVLKVRQEAGPDAEGRVRATDEAPETVAAERLRPHGRGQGHPNTVRACRPP